MATRVLLAALAFMLALATAELAVRVALPVFDPSAQPRLVPHGALLLGPPNSTARQAKNTGDYDVSIHFGPRGLRDARDVAIAGPEDVLVVGDSFAFGWGVEQRERFSDRLEALSGRRVWNLGIPGLDLDGYAELLRYAEQLGSRARQLVVSLTIETDLHEYGEAASRAAAATSTPTSWTRGWLADAKSWLASHSALSNLFTTAVHRVAWLEALAARAGLIEPNLARAGVGPQSTRVLRSVADRVATLVRGYDALVLLVPSRGLWLEHGRADEDRVHRRLVAELEARGLRVVDPRAAFEATGKPLAHHFAKDGHWNASGHRVAAELLARALSLHPAPAAPNASASAAIPHASTAPSAPARRPRAP